MALREKAFQPVAPDNQPAPVAYNQMLVLSPNESISIAQGIQAFTSHAAWQYGLDKQLGAIALGFTADLMFLSDDLRSMENNPDDLKSIRILATVHHGQYLPNPNASQTPIWPG